MSSPAEPAEPAAGFGCQAVAQTYGRVCELGDHTGCTHQITTETPTGPVPVLWIDTLAGRTPR